MYKKPLSVVATFLFLSASAPTIATELVYAPFNPSFGGNPLNGSVLLNSAQATKRHEEDKSAGLTAADRGSPLQSFNAMLERAILSRIASSVTGGIMQDGQLQPGTVDTANFTVVISDLGGGVLMISTTDKVTGASTSFQVSQ